MAVTALTTRGRSGFHASQVRAGMVFVIPYLIFFLVMQAGALAFAFWISLHRWDLLALENPFRGLENYTNLPENENFVIALRNTTYYAVVVTVLQTIFALIMAVLLNPKIRRSGVFSSYLH